MNIMTANIKSNPLMRQSKVDHDIDLVAKTGSVILWQEIQPERYKSKVRSLGVFQSSFMNTETPISYHREDWEPTAIRGEVKTHGGRFHVTPSRHITYEGLHLKRHAEIPPVIFMNTHMLSGAWSNKHMLTRKWRRAMWHVHFSKQQDLVRKLVGQGYTVIGGGDMNRGAMPKFTNNQRWLAVGGIDHMFVCEARGGARVRLTETSKLHRVYTDHAPRVAKVTLFPPLTAPGESK